MKRKSAIWFNLLIAVVSYAAWLTLIFRLVDSGSFADVGLWSLKYFTILSNLLNGTVCLVYALRLRSGRVSAGLQRWKLTGTAAVALTFWVVLLFLGPIFGYSSMYRGANLWMHLLLPLLSMAAYVLLDRGCRIPGRDSLFAALAPLVYALGYVLNILINGLGEGFGTNDWYGFLHWGWGIGFCILGVILLLTWLNALALNAMNGLHAGKTAKKP